MNNMDNMKRINNMNNMKRINSMNNLQSEDLNNDPMNQQDYDKKYTYSKEKSESNISLDSSCSFKWEAHLEKEKMNDGMQKNIKFLKNPTKKRMYKLKKIVEILEYTIYNEEKQGSKLEGKLYDYVVLTKNLKEKIINLENINTNNKNKMQSYEKDITKLKEQNEEMKLTLSTFENELSNLINKFDKNFAKELIDTKSQNDVLKKRSRKIER